MRCEFERRRYLNHKQAFLIQKQHSQPLPPQEFRISLGQACPKINKTTYLTENEHGEKSRMHLGVSWSFTVSCGFVVDTNVMSLRPSVKDFVASGKRIHEARHPSEVDLLGLSLFLDGQVEKGCLRKSDL